MARSPVPQIPQSTDEEPLRGPTGPRTPYPVEHPGISQQPGSSPDYVPGAPLEPPARM